MAEQAEQVCAICGQGGYWVGYAATVGEDRCLNHLDTPRVSDEEYVRRDAGGWLLSDKAVADIQEANSGG